MTPSDLSDLTKLLDQAAERGARKALREIGLHDEDAGKDIQDLRTLIDGWRSAKRTAMKAVIQYMTVALLGLLVLGTWTKFWGK